MVAGSFDSQTLQRKDEQGITLKEAITAIGGNPDHLTAEAIPAGQWLGYSSSTSNKALSCMIKRSRLHPVTAIAGQIRAEAVFTGMAGHAGTVPMEMRKDALCGAAEFILAAERLAETQGVLITVGKLQLANAASNVIPVRLSAASTSAVRIGKRWTLHWKSYAGPAQGSPTAASSPTTGKSYSPLHLLHAIPG